jgi:hypothetical protein
VALAASASASARADSAADDAAAKAIFELARATATKFSLELCRFGTLAYDKTEKPGGFATFRSNKDPEDLQLAYALFQHGDRVWRVKVKETGVHGWRCTDTGAAPKLPLHAEHVDMVAIGDIDEMAENTLALSFVDGDLIVRAEDDLRNAPSGNTDWVAPRFRWNGGDEPGAKDREYAIVLVQPKDAPPRKSVGKVRTFTTLGKTQGPSDATLDVKAELVGDHVAITMAIGDDKDIPLAVATASDADLLKSDHVEVWYQTGKEEAQVRQLGIARLADGTVHARWLFPREGKAAKALPKSQGTKTAPVALPKVTSPAPGTFVLEVPASDLFAGQPFTRGERNEIRFTAAFSDTDVAGRRQETLVATSLLEWGKWESLGKLVWLANGARFPRFGGGSRVDVEVTSAAK